MVLSIVVSIALVGAERGGNGLSSKKSDQAIAAEPTRSHCSVIRVLKSFWELVMAFIYRYYDQPSLNANSMCAPTERLLQRGRSGRRQSSSALDTR